MMAVVSYSCQNLMTDQAYEPVAVQVPIPLQQIPAASYLCPGIGCLHIYSHSSALATFYLFGLNTFLYSMVLSAPDQISVRCTKLHESPGQTEEYQDWHRIGLLEPETTSGDGSCHKSHRHPEPLLGRDASPQSVTRKHKRTRSANSWDDQI